MYPIKCLLMGHDYGEPDFIETEEAIEDKKKKIEIKRETCTNCGQSRQERENVTVTSNEKDNKTQNEGTSTSHSGSNRSTNMSGISSTSYDINSSTENTGAVVLDTETEVTTEESSMTRVAKCPSSTCDFSKESPKTEYRTGDACPYCGEWIRINEVQAN